MDPLRKVNKGDGPDRLLEASTFNCFIDAAKYIRDRMRGRVGAGEQKTDPLVPALTVYIRNDTGAALNVFDVVKVGDAATTVTDDNTSIRFADQPVFKGTTPGATNDMFAILKEPIGYPGGGLFDIGEAVVMGVVPVDVDITDTGHGYATPTPGNSTKLTSAVSGAARILHKPSGTGVKQCVVKLDETGAEGTTIPPNLPCHPHGWLVDAASLETAATANTPVRVLKVKVFPGDAGSRCACIVEQFTTGAVAPNNGIAHAFYDSGTDKWHLTRLIQTCCSCGRMAITIPGDNTWPPMTGQLTAVVTCDASSPLTYDLRYQCATENSVTFAAAGPKLCSDQPDGDPVSIPCNNAFYITVTCDECNLPIVECDECRELCAPPILHIPSVDFLNAYAVYDGPWYLPFISDSLTDPCKWEVVCGALTVTALMVRVGNDSVFQVTYSGGPGTVVYEYVEPLERNLICFAASHTLAVVSGDTADTPDTLGVNKIQCTACTDKCGSVDCFEIDTDVISTTGDCGALSIVQDPGVDRCIPDVPAGWAAAFDTDFGGIRTGETILSCIYGRLSIVFSSSGGPAFTFNYAVVSLAWDPLVYVVDITFTQSGCSSVYRVVFTQGS